MEQKMASKPTLTTPSVILTPTPITVPQNKSIVLPEEYHTLLIVIYTVVLLIGSTSLSVTIHIMKSRTSSTTSIAVLNLIFAHFLFLLTVPFRIYYHAAQQWTLSSGWCRVVSSMVHIHMYMSFGLYVVIILTRLLVFYHKAKRLESLPRIYAQAASFGMWMIVLVIVTCIVHFSYGHSKGEKNTLHSHFQCFRFGKNIEAAAKVINYIISALFITVAIVLTSLQASVLWLLYRMHHQQCTSQQDFGAQLKSLSFALIMVVCFIPYHIFRLYYLEHLELQNLNEVFLSLTTFNCVDMLTLLGRRTCSLCFPGKAI